MTTDQAERLARIEAARLAGDPAVVVARIEARGGLDRAEALRVVQQLDGAGLADLACIVEHLELMAATLRCFVPGRHDEIADLYGDVVAGHVLGAVGDGHLYDNARLEEQAAHLAAALDLPPSIRFPLRGQRDTTKHATGKRAGILLAVGELVALLSRLRTIAASGPAEVDAAEVAPADPARAAIVDSPIYLLTVEVLATRARHAIGFALDEAQEEAGIPEDRRHTSLAAVSRWVTRERVRVQRNVGPTTMRELDALLSRCGIAWAT